MRRSNERHSREYVTVVRILCWTLGIHIYKDLDVQIDTKYSRLAPKTSSLMTGLESKEPALRRNLFRSCATREDG